MFIVVVLLSIELEIICILLFICLLVVSLVKFVFIMVCIRCGLVVVGFVSEIIWWLFSLLEVSNVLIVIMFW